MKYINKVFKHRSSRLFLILFVLVFSIAVAFRFVRLGAIPAGQHQDEAWFAYNAFLLKTTGANIYGETLPLTVDMWGDHVSSFHSFAIVPFITLFGINTAVSRLPFVMASLMTMALAAWLTFRWTKNRWIALLCALFVATSHWNIIMARASSTVVLDSLVTLVTLTTLYEGLRYLSRGTATRKHEILLWLSTYSLTIFAYFTYFTSRLTLPVMMTVVILLSWYQLKFSRRLVMGAFTIIAAYAVFPFLIMLNTPYALGRYEETTVINSGIVRNQQFLDITRSGQAGLPAPITQFFFNKVTENARAVFVQYVAFFSPSVVLFQTAPPLRYFVPQTGVINIVEYIGMILAVASLFLMARSGQKTWSLAAGAAFVMTAVALLPAALTVDDWPNFQRGVFATPFWQIAAAIGWGIAIKQFTSKRGRLIVLTGMLGILTFSSTLFIVSYFVQSPYANVFYRSRAGEKLGVWVNANAHDAVILMDHDEANFVYPYIYAQENVRELGLTSPEKYILKSPEFRIGNRHYVWKLCSRSDMLDLLEQINPDVLIVKLEPPYDRCEVPIQYQPVESISYDNGTVVYSIYRRVDEPLAP